MNTVKTWSEEWLLRLSIDNCKAVSYCLKTLVGVIFRPYRRKSSLTTRHFPSVRTEIYTHIFASFRPYHRHGNTPLKACHWRDRHMVCWTGILGPVYGGVEAGSGSGERGEKKGKRKEINWWWWRWWWWWDKGGKKGKDIEVAQWVRECGEGIEKER